MLKAPKIMTKASGTYSTHVHRARISSGVRLPNRDLPTERPDFDVRLEEGLDLELMIEWQSLYLCVGSFTKYE
jgi:hypothetical protein